MPTKSFQEIRAAKRGSMTPAERDRTDIAGDILASTLRLGIAIRDAREELGVTQTELANRLGIAQSAISRLEAGRTNVSVGTLTRVAKALSVGLTVGIGTQTAQLRKP